MARVTERLSLNVGRLDRKWSYGRISNKRDHERAEVLNAAACPFIPAGYYAQAAGRSKQVEIIAVKLPGSTLSQVVRGAVNFQNGLSRFHKGPKVW